MIYLDNAATTPVHSDVVQVINEALVNNYGNPSSIYRLGKTAKMVLSQAREDIANVFGVETNQVYFTSGATESDNWVIRSQAYRARDLGYGHHIVTTSIEHSAVLKTLEQLQEEGFTYTKLDPNEEGQYTVEAFENATTPDTIGWIAMAVNNETGAVLPVLSLGEAAKELDLWFHSDTAQAIGKVDWDWTEFPATSWVITAHKINGPKGIGILIYRPWNEAMHLIPEIVGGGQERGMRAGTENIPYILGIAEALKIVERDRQTNLSHYALLREELLSSLDQHHIEYKINGDLNNHVDNIIQLWFPGKLSSQLIIQLDLANIAISAGSACSAGSIKESRIVNAYYPDQSDRAVESVRISFGISTTVDEIHTFVETLANILRRE